MRWNPKNSYCSHFFMFSSGNTIFGFLKKEVHDGFKEAALKILEYFNTDKILPSCKAVFQQYPTKMQRNIHKERERKRERKRVKKEKRGRERTEGDRKRKQARKKKRKKEMKRKKEIVTVFITCLTSLANNGDYCPLHLTQDIYP